jgi:predicted DNA-binding ribbon-helix-helix protein
MKSCIVKRSIIISHHKTSISLEDAFWTGLKEIARSRRLTLSEMVGVIESERTHGNLSSAVRLFVLGHYRNLFGAAANERNSQLQKITQGSASAPLDRS